MPKAKVEEEEVPAEEPQEEEEAEEPAEEVVPETPEPEKVTIKPKSKARTKPQAKETAVLPKKKAAPPTTKKKEPLDLKQKHQCGRCGKTMSLHTALYSHKCPGEVSVPQPPALTRQVAVEEPPEEEEPQMSHAQLLRLHLAKVAQERRAQHHFRMVNPIRSFYGLG